MQHAYYRGSVKKGSTLGEPQAISPTPPQTASGWAVQAVVGGGV